MITVYKNFTVTTYSSTSARLFIDSKCTKKINVTSSTRVESSV